MKIRLTKTAISGNTKFGLFISLLILKILYMLSVDLLLPEDYLIWSFDKNIDWTYFYVELIAFVVCAVTYIGFYKKGNAFNFFTTLFFVLFFIPANSCLVLSGVEIEFFLLINSFCWLMILAMVLVMSNDKTEKVSVSPYIENLICDKKKVKIMRVALIAVCFATLIRVYLTNGLDIMLIFQEEMYDVRAEYAEAVADVEGTLLSYILVIVTPITSWFLPIYLYFSLKKKSLIDIVLCLFTFLANFSLSMQKSQLFIVAIPLFVLFVENKKRVHKICLWFVYGMVLAFLLIFIEYFVRGESAIFTLVVRRIFYMPQYLEKVYYDFFVVKEKFWFRHDALFLQNIISIFVSSPYEHGATKLISERCFEGILPSPNTGMFAEAYAQMGGIGIIIFPWIFAGIVKYMKKSSEWFGEGVSFVILAKLLIHMCSVFVLSSGSLVGILVFILIVEFLKIISRTGKVRVNYR